MEDIENRELQGRMDGRTDGEDSQQIAAAFSRQSSKLSSLFLESRLFTSSNSVEQHCYGNSKINHLSTVLGAVFPFTNSSELNSQK